MNTTTDLVRMVEAIATRRRRRWPALLAAVAPAGLFAAPAQAEVLVFTGESVVDGTNWHDSGNWRRLAGDRGHVPTSADDAMIPPEGRRFSPPPAERHRASSWAAARIWTWMGRR